MGNPTEETCCCLSGLKLRPRKALSIRCHCAMPTPLDFGTEPNSQSSLPVHHSRGDGTLHQALTPVAGEAEGGCWLRLG